MPIDFPNSPANGATYSTGGLTYTYITDKGQWQVNNALTANDVNQALGYTAYNANTNSAGFVNASSNAFLTTFNNPGNFYYNSRTISANVTIANTESALSVGTITIANNVTVTIADGGEWSIV